MYIVRSRDICTYEFLATAVSGVFLWRVGAATYAIKADFADSTVHIYKYADGHEL